MYILDVYFIICMLEIQENYDTIRNKRHQI